MITKRRRTLREHFFIDQLGGIEHLCTSRILHVCSLVIVLYYDTVHWIMRRDREVGWGRRCRVSSGGGGGGGGGGRGS